MGAAFGLSSFIVYSCSIVTAKLLSLYLVLGDEFFQAYFQAKWLYWVPVVD